MYFRPEIQESLTLKFAEAATQRLKEGKEIISFGLGEPDFDVPNELVEATIDVLRHHKSGYSNPMGLPGLKGKLANKLNVENNIPANSNNILITPGAKQAFQMALFALLEPGDEVIVINPSFVSFIPQIYIAEPGAEVKIIDVDKTDFSIPMQVLEAQINERTKVLVINSPNNPAGYTMSDEELGKIYSLAKRFDFYIISDEIYEKLMFTADAYKSIGSKEEKIERIFTINGYSKSHAMTGWRLGYLCFPDAFFQKLLKLQQHINTNTCTFIQQGVLNAFEMDMSYLNQYKAKLKQRAQKVVEMVNNTPGLYMAPPSAGFFAFINISELKLDSNTFCSKLIEETGVATTPGLAFGKSWDDHFRLSYAVNDDLLERGLVKISEFVNQLKSDL